MRHPRIKFEEGHSGFLHVYNRTVGNTGQYPFGRVEKAEFIRRLNELNAYYTVEVLAVQVMGNHYHALLFVPALAPSREEAAALLEESGALDKAFVCPHGRPTVLRLPFIELEKRFKRR